MKIPVILAAAALALSACTANTRQPGQILDYTRTNTDGSEWESVSIYRKSEVEVEVYKMRSRCTNAALVTAKFDPSTDEAVSLTGGRLTRDGKQEAFAYLMLEPNDRNLEVRFDAPDSPPSQSLTLPGTPPWRLFDFDFADINALARKPRRGETLRWTMALIWPDAPAESSLQLLGELSASWDGTESRRGIHTHRYSLSGAGFDGGWLWLDTYDGTVVEAVAPRPNHPGYRDFRLVRTGESKGAKAWSERLADHWTGCPALAE